MLNVKNDNSFNNDGTYNLGHNGESGLNRKHIVSSCDEQKFKIETMKDTPKKGLVLCQSRLIYYIIVYRYLR